MSEIGLLRNAAENYAILKEPDSFFSVSVKISYGNAEPNDNDAPVIGFKAIHTSMVDVVISDPFEVRYAKPLLYALGNTIVFQCHNPRSALRAKCEFTSAALCACCVDERSHRTTPTGLYANKQNKRNGMAFAWIECPDWNPILWILINCFSTVFDSGAWLIAKPLRDIVVCNHICERLLSGIGYGHGILDFFTAAVHGIFIGAFCDRNPGIGRNLPDNAASQAAHAVLAAASAIRIAVPDAGTVYKLTGCAEIGDDCICQNA
ncbi:hypothetical protein [Oscillibacter sp. PC13]|uniref:hypothetical protein n=1 Tax=Oscillibacter sp. PC13 TaxID=1855299 RepID=UPI001FA8C24B|nr:hypothetical protein [Oscillibacter sp. PC13]